VRDEVDARMESLFLLQRTKEIARCRCVWSRCHSGAASRWPAIDEQVQ